MSRTTKQIDKLDNKLLKQKGIAYVRVENLGLFVICPDKVTIPQRVKVVKGVNVSLECCEKGKPLRFEYNTNGSLLPTREEFGKVTEIVF